MSTRMTPGTRFPGEGGWTNGFGGEYHIKLKISGNKIKQTIFHDILSGMDRDYPTPAKMQKICEHCGGLIYKAARFQPHQLLAFAKQISEADLLPGRLKLKIKRYCTGIMCAKSASTQKKIGKETTLCKS